MMASPPASCHQDSVSPPGLGLVVPHYQVAEAEASRGAEHQGPPLHRPIVHEGGVAQWTMGDHHRYPSDSVVDHLVECHDADRICPGVIADPGHLNRLPVLQPLVGLGNGVEPGVVYGRYPVLAQPTAEKLLVGDSPEPEVGPPQVMVHAEAGAGQLLLELCLADDLHSPGRYLRTSRRPPGPRHDGEGGDDGRRKGVQPTLPSPKVIHVHILASEQVSTLLKV